MSNQRFSKTRLVGCPHEPKTWFPGRAAWLCPVCMSAVCSACKAKYVIYDAVDGSGGSTPTPPAVPITPAPENSGEGPAASASSPALPVAAADPAATPAPPAGGTPGLGTPPASASGEGAPWWFYGCKCPSILTREVLLPPRLWLTAPLPIDEKIEPPPSFDGAPPLAKFLPENRANVDLMQLLPKTLGGIVEFLDHVDRITLFHLESGRTAEAQNYLEMASELRKIRNQNPAVRRSEEDASAAAAKRKRTLDLFDQPGLGGGSPLMKKRMGDLLVYADDRSNRRPAANSNGWLYAGVALFAAACLAALVFMR